jgi:hypothetical protein
VKPKEKDSPMDFLKNRSVIVAILAIAAAVATFTATTVDDALVKGISDWYNANQVEVIEPSAVVPALPVE